MSKQDRPASRKQTPKKASAGQAKPKQAAPKKASPKGASAKQATDTGAQARKSQTGKSQANKPAAKSSKLPARKSPARKPAHHDYAPTPSSQLTADIPLISVPMMVRWRDLDAFNHVNNSKFLSYLEEARLQWLMTLPGEWIDENIAPVVAAAHINYLRPIEWPNEIAIELFVERLGNTSLTIGHRILGATDSNALYADGNVVMVWIDKQGGKAAALPEVVRAACRSA